MYNNLKIGYVPYVSIVAVLRSVCCCLLEHYLTDTARFADVVLPATMQLEHLDLHWSWGHHYLTLNEPAIEPVGECLPNSEIFRRLAARLGLDDPPSARRTSRCSRRCSPPRRSRSTRPTCGRAGSPRSTSARGRCRTPRAASHAVGQARAARRRAGRAGHRPAAALPPAGRGGRRCAGGRLPLALLTPKTHLFLNSTFANGVRQHAAQPEPMVYLNAADAEPRGIADGDRVRVANDRGALPVPRGRVGRGPAGRRRGADGLVEYATTRAAFHPQVATPQLLTRLGEAPTFNDCRVEVARV